MSPCRVIAGVALALLACGPPAGVEDSTGPGGGTTTGPEPVPAAEWMSGLYSNRRITHDTARFTENGDVAYYEFLADWTFLGPLSGNNSDEMRSWAPLTDTQARIYPNPSDSPDVHWWDARAVTSQDGCTRVALTRVGSIETGAGTLYPGKVCVVDVPCPPDQKPFEGCSGYRLVWCDEPPPGCDETGCVCDEPTD